MQGRNIGSPRIGKLAAASLSLILAVLLIACDEGGASTGITGSISIDGSSTVFPITEAVAEEFLRVESKIKVTVGITGTGGGFQKFCRGETAVQDASRPISAKEIGECEANNYEWIELPVAYDAITVVVNPRNDWATCLTVAELKKIWEPAAQGTINNWNQVRDSFPDAPLKLYGAGTDSGSFDYFTEVINGKSKDSRGDYTASEDDNTLVQGVSNDRNALGYFGLAYYEENSDKLKAVQVDGGEGCTSASAETVENGSYSPLSRPLFIYVRRDEADKDTVGTFIDFYLENAGFLASDVGYVRFPENIYDLVLARWTSRTTGTMFTAGEHSTSLEQLLSQ